MNKNNISGNKYSRLITLILFFLMIFSIIPGAFSAPPQENQGQGPPAWVNTGGKNFNANIPVGLQKKASLAGNTSENGYRISYEYQNDNSDTEKSLGLSIVGLIEFIDTNENGLPDAGEKISWHNITDDNLNITGYENEDFMITELSSGPLRVIFYVPLDNVSSGLRQLTSGEVKFDIIIENYAYSSDNSRIAAVIMLENVSLAKYGINSTSGEHGFLMGGGNESLYFSWVSNATVDGIDENVSTGINIDNQSITMTFAFSKGNNIYYDPYFGVSATAVIDNILETIIDDFIEEIIDQIDEKLGIIYGNIKIFFTTIFICTLAVFTSRYATTKYRKD